MHPSVLQSDQSAVEPRDPFTGLPVRVRNALAQASIETLEQLTSCSRIDLLRKKNMGRVTLVTLEEFLSELGLALKGGTPPPVTIKELAASLEHMQHCRSCGESSWEDCDGGRAALAALARARGER